MPGVGATRRGARVALGMPDVRGRRSLVAAILIDSLGTGLFLPFAVIYPTVVAHIPLSVTGAMLSLATLCALPIPLLAGLIVDHMGARVPIVAANLAQAVGFASYLAIARPWHLFACALCVAIGNQAYWAANGAFLSAVARPAERTRWFALQGACRGAGLGAGTAAAGLAAATLASGQGYRLLAALNAVSFVVAAALSVRVPIIPATADTHTDRGGRARPRRWAALGGYRPILRDGPFLGFTATNVAFSLCVLSFALVLPPFVLGTLRQPPWVVGMLFTLNTVAVATMQTAVTAWIAHFRRTRAIACAAGLFGLAFIALALVSRLVPRPPEAHSEARGWVVASLLAAMGLYTLAELVMAPLKNALVADAAPEASRGRYLAFYHLSWSLASTAAPALLTSLLALGALALWPALAAVALLAALALLRLDALLPAHAVRPPNVSATFRLPLAAHRENVGESSLPNAHG
jgi:MFS family permease